jgi:hypothetical protein
MWLPGDVIAGPAPQDLFLVLRDGSFSRLRNNHNKCEFTPQHLGKGTFRHDSTVCTYGSNKKLFNLFELLEQVGV